MTASSQQTKQHHHRGSNSTTMRAIGESNGINGEEPERLQVDNNSDVDSDNDSAYDANMVNCNHQNDAAVATFETSSSQQDPSAMYMAQFGEIGYGALKFIAKFVDRVCMEGCLNDQQRLALHANLVDVISMQIQTLETVFTESRRVPARSKPKIENLKPDFMLNGER